MTLVAGIFSRHGRDPIDPAWRRTLSASLSRHPGETVTELGDDRCFLAVVDVGAYSRPAVASDPSGALSVVAGEPLLTDGDGDPHRSRAADVAVLHAAWKQDRWDILTRASGVFSAVHYRPAEGRLWLTTDCLGVRPLYFWLGPRHVVFSSVLRALEALPLVPKRMDVRAVVEMTSIGIPLGDRTPYVGIHRIGAAEVVAVGESADRRSHYRRWDEVELRDAGVDQVVAQVDASFRAAVRRRLRTDRTTGAFLSGGMDSRALVAALHAEGAVVHTFNISPPGTQDAVFAADFARAAGIAHRNVAPRLEIEAAKFAMTLAAEWSALLEGKPHPAEHPRLVWSGDGGSVGMGHVYISALVARLLREGKREQAVDAFLGELKATVARRILRPEMADRFAEVPREGILEELEAIRHPDPVRGFHLFLLLNDQRRHLTGHFENIDLHRLEFHLPFFDPALLETVISAPVDLFLFHRLYTRWFSRLGPAVVSVPWQTYPGHEPCPLPVSADLGYQWHADTLRVFRRHRERQLLQESGQLLRSEFPDPILRRGQLRVARWLHLAGVRNCAHALRTATVYGRYWQASGGTFVLPRSVAGGALAGADLDG